MWFSPRFSLVVGVAMLVGCADEGPSNTLPTAAFTVACDDLTCNLTNSSTDADGTIEAHAWDFGDGATSTEQHPSHTYAAPGGEFTVGLTVTDDRGGAATAAWQVNVSPGNTAPVAAFVVACTNIICSFTDQSTDPDAGDSLVSHAWSFGDGGMSMERNPIHIYPHLGGQYTVTLTVADDSGARATAENQIDVAWDSVPDRSGTYERETPHSTPGRHSRFVIRGDGTFELQDSTGAAPTVYTGRWANATNSWGIPVRPGTAFLLDFDAWDASGPFDCGEGFATFFMDTHLAFSFCGDAFRAGLEEGFYTSAPGPETPGPPPPQAGQLLFVRDGRVHRANTDGGGLVQLSTGPGDGHPAWSPDGNRIAFERSGGAAPGIYVMDADGSNVVQRATSGGAPTWSPDGEWIAFVCEIGLCKVRTGGDSAAPVGMLAQPGQVSSPSWSPDGTRIAHSSDWGLLDIWFDIWVVAPDGAQLTALITHTPDRPNPYQFYQPAWSPDGGRLAYLTCPWAWDHCSSSVVSVMNADGFGMVWLATASGFAKPTWSPDGQFIAFASSNAIEWVSADGSQRGRIIGDGHSPAWRP